MVINIMENLGKISPMGLAGWNLGWFFGPQIYKGQTKSKLHWAVYFSQVNICRWNFVATLKNKIAEERDIGQMANKKKATSDWRTQTRRELFEQGISKLVYRYEKRGNMSGDYIEK